MNNDGKLSEQQWNFLDDLSETVWKMVPYMTDKPNVSELREYLHLWIIYLGILTADTFQSQILLVKNGRLRVAYMLHRPLMEYMTRIRFYVLQALPCLESWEAGRCQKEYAEKQIKAVAEWREGESRLLNILKHNETVYDPEVRLSIEEARASYIDKEKQSISQFWDMHALTPDLLRRREEKIKKSGNILVYKNTGLDFDKYLQQVKDVHEAVLTFSKGTWEATSAFLHGLPDMQTDVVRGNLTIYRTPPGMREADIMLESTHYVIAFMEAIEHLSGWCYGLAAGTPYSLHEKVRTIFRESYID